MNTRMSQNVRLSAAAERQMRTWAKMQDLADHAIHESSAERLPPRANK